MSVYVGCSVGRPQAEVIGYVSYRLTSLKGLYGDYIGDYYREY